ncbi:hypothetical protein MIT9_P2338 [Methylomarinovum caldicuralii]|uniref:Uncharacterized protein n=1 Tax=Methylomarinovum caldicuralii TaxID=438856 RepID=A0AAU9CTC5_9GAMM|nr:hypothetical protein [Methylomarinovum caldicuralii]BCX82752.1 hypothetical protein MIT9_P2338 [Methylomarinovum caldicuralii]
MPLKDKITPLLAKLPQSNRPRHTLLYVTREATFRAEADGRGRLMGDVETVEKTCDGVDYLPEAVEYVLTQGPRPARRVWILYDRLETHSLALPEAQTTGIGAAALTQALMFELEAVTGMSIVNRQIGYTLTASDDEMRNYWVSLLSQRVFDRLSHLVRQNRARLAAVLHPGGLPAPLTEGFELPWLRIEHWPEVVIALCARHRDEPPEVNVIPTEGMHDGGEGEIAEWLEEHGDVTRREVLSCGRTLLLGEDEQPTYRLDHLEDRQRWLARWAAALAGRDLHVPLLQDAHAINPDYLYMGLSGAAALLVVAAHFGWHTWQKYDYHQKTAELKQIEQQIKTLRDGIKARRDKLDALKGEVSALHEGFKDFPTLLERLRSRPARLLAALARARPAGVVLDGIGRDGDIWKIHGVAVTFSAPNRYATALEAPVATLGFEVLPPVKQDRDLFVHGGPWEFDINLKDLGLAEVARGADG